MSALTEIVGVDPDLLYKKFDLEPWYNYDPHQQENKAFLSPTVLLDDLKIRDGGYKDRGPKEVLSRLANDILSSKELSLFRVPEIPYVHIGYGTKSETKKHNMAITENEAKVWMKFLDFTRHKQDGGELREHETPMEVDVTLPNPDRAEEYHAFELEEGATEELIDPSCSGLKRIIKGSYLLFFSILMIFFEKKNVKPATNTKDKEPSIGANKISDFLLFWILPYLLNFTHRKLSEINAHHKRKSEEEGVPIFTVPVLEKSTMDIINDIIKSCQVPIKLEKSLIEKYRKYYGTEQLERKYNLPKTRSHTPIILVPLSYKVVDMPVEIEDLGTRQTWKTIGNVNLFKEFINKFVENVEIQSDILHSFGYLKERFAVDYGIIFPDEATFNKLIANIEEDHPNILKRLPEQGRDLLQPRLGLVKHSDGNQTVCFSYFPGRDAHSVNMLFRLVTSNRLNHFTLLLLYGLCGNSDDPNCRLLSLYPVKSCRKYHFNDDKAQGGDVRGEIDKNFKGVVGKFCSLEFPETLKSLKQAICSDEEVRRLIKGSRVKLSYPEFVHKPLEVAYAKAADQSKLRKHLAISMRLQDNYRTRAANLDGCLLSMISRKSRNVGVVLGINDTLEPFGSLLASLQNAMTRVITHFVLALVVGGLPKAYPLLYDEEVEEDNSVESGSFEDDDESFAEELPATATGASSYGDSGIAASNSSSGTEQRIKQGTPTNDELEFLGADIGNAWMKLGRRLEIQDPKLEEIDKTDVDLSEKGYRMLRHWKQEQGSAATYQVLCQALEHRLVNRQDLAEEHCYEQL